MNTENGWRRYLQLMKERPEDFRRDSRGLYVLQTDEEVVREFERSTGRRIGVCYESKYKILVVDLLKSADGRLYAYERVLPAVRGGAVVCVTRHADKYVMIRQYRHALGREQIAFVRGYGEYGVSPEDNAKKEVKEELGADVRFIAHLGKVAPDSGTYGQTVDVFECEIDDWAMKPGYEGITGTCEYSHDELTMAIAGGQIDDGFSLSAFALIAARGNSSSRACDDSNRWRGNLGTHEVSK